MVTIVEKEAIVVSGAMVGPLSARFAMLRSYDAARGEAMP